MVKAALRQNHCTSQFDLSLLRIVQTSLCHREVMGRRGGRTVHSVFLIIFLFFIGINRAGA